MVSPRNALNDGHQYRRLVNKMEAPELPQRLSYNTLKQRKGNGEILYYEIFKWKMKHAPNTIHRFCDVSLGEKERDSLNSWIRYTYLPTTVDRQGKFKAGAVYP